ncbi:MAG: hypothetical protein COA82_09880 [Alkaliphilus sp.]|nr:hypothetical protein [bacterium AH-315-L21]MBN4056549.1 hypothetical protein [bacterium AH-315-K05]MBN4074316.1 hypothetical protein [bacterium AH-315-E09]PHS31777.1 MAG: hypothetical protein COA82_09880 [Alkaliphilus sp.]
MKRIIAYLVFSIIIASTFFTSFAYVVNKSLMEEIQESNPIFINFLSDSKNSEIKVINSVGKTVNDMNSVFIKKNLVLGNYEEVYNSLKKFNLSLSYETSEKVENKQNRDNMPMIIDSEVKFNRYYYHLETDNSGMFSKEWLTILSGRYMENADGTFTALGSPRINVEADFGASFSVNPHSYSTGYQYQDSNQTIVFDGSYTMKATLVFPVTIGGFTFPIGRTYYWGRTYVSHTVR